jgi:hypothetical protein
VPHVPFTGAPPTVTVADASDEVPPAPVHWRPYVCVVVSGPTPTLPESKPEFVHEPVGEQLDAFVELQDSVELPLYGIDAGEAVSVAVGAVMATETEEYA